MRVDDVSRMVMPLRSPLPWLGVVCLAAIPGARLLAFHPEPDQGEACQAWDTWEDGLVLSIAPSKPVFEPGEQVDVETGLFNFSGELVSFVSMSQYCDYDVRVRDEAGIELQPTPEARARASCVLASVSIREVCGDGCSESAGRITLSDWYDLRREGRYVAWAYRQHLGRMERDWIRSNDITFTVRARPRHEGSRQRRHGRVDEGGFLPWQ